MSYPLLRELVELLSLALEGVRVLNLAGIHLEGEVREVDDVAEADLVLCKARDLAEGNLLKELSDKLGESSIAIVVDRGYRVFLRPAIVRDLASSGLGIAYVFADHLPAIVYRKGYSDEFASRAISIWRDSMKLGPMPISVNAAKALYAITKLVASKRGGRVVEIGTGLGFSTMFLAHACAEARAKLVSIEVREDRASYALKALESAGLSDVVSVVVGDAKSLNYGSRDVVLAFIDGKKEEYCSYLESLEPFLAPRAMLLAHNTLSHPHLVASYIARVYRGSYRSLTIAVDPSGLTMSVRLA